MARPQNYLTFWLYSMAMNEINNNQSNVIIYEDSAGDIKLDVFMQDETVWLNQEHMSVLFNKSVKTISEHIRNIFAEGELDKKVVIRKFRNTRKI